MRILVADDHDLVRETIAAFLSAADIAEVRGVATLDAAVALAEESGSFDLVLLDYDMPGMRGLEGLARMRVANNGRPVAILSGTATREVAEAALEAGAQGFIPKTLAARSLLTAARFMAAGEIYAPFDFMNGRGETADETLTRREYDMLRGICEGKSNKEIARDHDLQEVTVKLHVKTLTRKLGARNRTQAAMIARDRGLV
ncbi:response regulator [Thetidibacter halocola]|uniref:Response regulator transcription factor n=1 Tax=Thetidibacter halocola TaxID=2827239 RepID=A0A8J7WE84_9RHOB|nr:response regulator transcription factor [Thetidibacter halocola]MBS0124101.1 response regulator transcription factor [Thetidibacter halocola]